MADFLTPKRSRMGIGDQDHHQKHNSERKALISFANENFGLHCWSHSITHHNVDYVDFVGGKYSVGVVVFVKVELKNGIHHQDVGYGMCNSFESKGHAISYALQEAVTNGLREALQSFGVEFKGLDDKSNTATPEEIPDKSHYHITETVVDSRTDKHMIDTSPVSGQCTVEDDQKLERKRRQRQKQEEFLQKLKQKQITNVKEPETRQDVSTVDMKKGKENDAMITVDMDDDALISTQEMNLMVQSATVQLDRTPLLSSPTNTLPSWPPNNGNVTPRSVPFKKKPSLLSRRESRPDRWPL